jgi:hypothetical protein
VVELKWRAIEVSARVVFGESLALSCWRGEISPREGPSKKKIEVETLGNTKKIKDKN